MKKGIGTCFLIVTWLVCGVCASQAGILSVRGKALGPDGITVLPGDGLPITGPEGYVQCIYAGPAGAIDPPGTDGAAGGDDVLLETAEHPGQFFTAVGEGFPFSPEGRFFEDFTHSLTTGARIYVRVWNGQAPASSTHYGDSGLYTLSDLQFQENDYGQWSTGTSLAVCKDLDGDGYGNPAGPGCAHPEPDCDDSNPSVNPGMTEIPGNGLDDDCSAGTPPWGTPASTLSREDAAATSWVNVSLLVLLPGGVVLFWRRIQGRRRGGRS